MIFLVGGNGFVGSAYARLFARRGLEHVVLTRENAGAYRGKSCDILINANGNSKKYLADREPLTDFEASVASVAKSLDWFHADRYVLLSSGDVYPDTASPEMTHEDQRLVPARQSRYGLHKSLAETLVCGVHPRHLILRMGGFVGPGLRKNAIYDMLTGQPLWLDPGSKLQFIQTDTAAEIVYELILRGVENQIVNLGANGTVLLSDVYTRIRSGSPLSEGARRVVYELDLSRLESLYGRPLPTSREEIWRFLDTVPGVRASGRDPI